MDQKMKRANILKRLFDAQKKKVPTELDEESRHKEASCLMDRLVGPDWRIEIQLPDITIMTPPSSPPASDEERISTPAGCVSAVNQAAESFYDRVKQAMDKEGIGLTEALEWDTGADNDPKTAKKRMQLTEELLGRADKKRPKPEEEQE